MRSVFTLCIIFFSYLFISAQSTPELVWQTNYGGTKNDYATAISHTDDNGYIICGETFSDNGDVSEHYGTTTSSDYWIAKVDSAGNIEWEKNYGGSSSERPSSIIRTSDAYIIAGKSYSDDMDVPGNHSFSYTDVWLLKINFDGEIIWSKSYGGTKNEHADCIEETFDGGYIFTARTKSVDGDISTHHGIIPNEDIWLVKIDSAGEIEWEKCLGGTSDDVANDILVTLENNYFIAGATVSIDDDVSANHGEADGWLIKLDSEGNIIWEKTYGGTDGDGLSSLILLDEGGLLIGGTTESRDGDVSSTHDDTTYWYIGDYWVIETDSLGNILWEKTYGGAYRDGLTKIMKGQDGNYVITGSSNSADGDVSGHHGASGDWDYWALKIDTTGNIISQNSYGGSQYDYVHSSDLGLNGSLVIAGESDSFDGDITDHFGLAENIYDYWVVNICFRSLFYADADNDGYGDILADSMMCQATAGFVSNNSDCDDANNLINPSAIEICNAFDDNCNTNIDEGFAFINYYLDADGDNYGNPLIDSLACETIDGYIIDQTDCDDSNPAIYPYAPEIADGLDNNCNDTIDEGLVLIHEIENLIALNIYPNPAKNYFFVELNLPAQAGSSQLNNTEIKISITNILGEEIYAEKSNLIGGKLNEKIQLQGKLSVGIYTVQIISEKNSTSKNIIVQ